MVFKKVAMEYAQFDTDNLDELRKLVEQNCELYNQPLSGLSDDKSLL